MTMWDFASANPGTACIMSFIVIVGLTHTICINLLQAYKTRIRHKNILAHGWPKPPMDADGDIIYPDSEEAA